MSKIKKIAITLCLLGLGTIVAVEVFYYSLNNWLMGKGETSVVTSSQNGTGTDSLESQQTIFSKKDYSIIERRNLFGSQGGLAAKESRQIDFNSLEKSDLDIVLLGTIKTDAEDGIGGRAIIFNKRTGKQDLYREGDTVLNATIKKILRTKVVITHNRKDQIIDMSESHKHGVDTQSQPVAVMANERPELTLPSLHQKSTQNVHKVPSGETPADRRVRTVRVPTQMKTTIPVKGSE